MPSSDNAELVPCLDAGRSPNLVFNYFIFASPGTHDSNVLTLSPFVISLADSVSCPVRPLIAAPQMPSAATPRAHFEMTSQPQGVRLVSLPSSPSCTPCSSFGEWEM